MSTVYLTKISLTTFVGPSRTVYYSMRCGEVGNELIKTLMENPLSQYILGHKKIIYFALLEKEGIEGHLSFSKIKGWT